MSRYNRRSLPDYDGRRDDRGQGGGYRSEGYRGHGGGRGPSDRQNNTSRPTECRVVVNYNTLTTTDPPDEVDICVYNVAIKSGYWKAQLDENGKKKFNPDTGKIERNFITRSNYVCDDERFEKRFFSSPKPWRIYKTLLKNEQAKNPSFHLDYDGVALALAPSSCAPNDDISTYQVCIKRDCDADHRDADLVKNEWFEVTLSKTHVIPFSNLYTSIRGEAPEANTTEFSNAINLIMKSTGIRSGMIPFGSSLYFPLEDQNQLFNKMTETKDKKKILLSGFNVACLFSHTGCNIRIDPTLHWFDQERVPIIPNEYTIAGVQVDLRTLRDDENAQKQIEDNLSKVSLDFEYVSRKTNDKEVEGGANRSPRRVFLNQTLQGKRGERIKWSPNDHSFEKDGVEITVTQHYLDAYGIELNQNLPIVDVGKAGKLPLQFASQSFAGTKGTNEPEMVREVLKVWDGIAGARLRGELTSKGNLISGKLEGGLAKYGLRIINEPKVLAAKVLAPPLIRFGNRTADVTNGSFDLRNAKFSRPAELNSFAVVDFTRDPQGVQELISKLLHVSKNVHGMIISEETKEVVDYHLGSVTIQCHDRHPEDVAKEAGRLAIQKSMDVNLHDSLHIYENKKIWHKTSCEVESGGCIQQCLVLPPGGKFNPEDTAGLMFPPSEKEGLRYFTHGIILKQRNENNYFIVVNRTRLKVIIGIDEGRSTRVIDPFDVTSRNARDIVGYCFECHRDDQKPELIGEEKVESVMALHGEDRYPVKCPDIILGIFENNDKAPYDVFKSITNIFYGPQTQCIVLPTYLSQKNKDQYASNVALKINTKLSDSISEAAAWSSPVPWVSECPTLVIVIGMVRGMGFGADTVVCANSCLDSQCMRFASTAYLQKKADSVDKYTIRDIYEKSYDKYRAENDGEISQRILIFRDGISDGNFNKADDEIAFLRDAINRRQHNIRVVPENKNEGFIGRGRGGVNVYSGTVVDNASILEPGTLRKITDEVTSSIRSLNQPNKSVLGVSAPSYDFFITAQGGLKGSSKPVYARVRLNENACWGPKGCTALTIENLENIFYQMSFKYGSATKAVREIPVIKYAKKLGNQLLNNLNYLREGVTMGPKAYCVQYKLEYPPDGMEDEADSRPFIGKVVKGQQGGRIYNLVECSYYSHLAA